MAPIRAPYWTGPVTPRRVQVSTFVIVLCAIIAFYNRREARVKTRPLREELESWIADLKDSDLGGASDAY